MTPTEWVEYFTQQAVEHRIVKEEDRDRVRNLLQASFRQGQADREFIGNKETIEKIKELLDGLK